MPRPHRVDPGNPAGRRGAGRFVIGWPASDSDQATTGPMALHVAEGRRLPLFFFGLSCMVPIQAYVGAGRFGPAGTVRGRVQPGRNRAPLDLHRAGR